MSKPSNACLADASVLILLEKVEKLDLLPKLFGSVNTTPEVLGEWGGEKPKWLHIVSHTNIPLYNLLRLTLGKGESSMIAYAQEQQNLILILDDAQARKAALHLGLNITGTLGICLMAKKQGLLANISEIITALSLSGMRISDSLVTKVLASAGEASSS